MTAYPDIVKADGTIEAFDPVRLAHSLMRAGAGRHTADRVAEAVTATVTPGSSSREVYARAFSLLRKEGRPLAARYALRRALLELGPSGHPFEDFISHLFRKDGWQVETRKMIPGHCVVHETDFFAMHPAHGERLAAELKFHNDPAYKTDLKVALYVKSRFDDIFAVATPGTTTCPIDRGILITNTKFTSEAIQYAECAGVELLGWSYPEHDNLRARMERLRVYPVTALTSLTKNEKRILLDRGTIAIDQVVEDRARLEALRLDPERFGVLMAEAAAVVGS